MQFGIGFRSLNTFVADADAAAATVCVFVSIFNIEIHTKLMCAHARMCVYYNSVCIEMKRILTAHTLEVQ